MELVDREDIFYPESDGAPVGETWQHFMLLVDLIHVLLARYRGQQVAVGGNQFVYYEEGNPRKVVCPDLYVVFGADPDAPRRTWKTWERGAFPHVILELLSDSTAANDLGPKLKLYEDQGVEEYFTYDLLDELAPPKLRGWRRSGSALVTIPPEAGQVETLRSESLGLLLQAEGEKLRLIDAATGRRLPFREEAAARAEAEIERLRTEIEHLRRRDPDGPRPTK